MTVGELIEFLKEQHSERMDCPVVMLKEKEQEPGDNIDDQVLQIAFEVSTIETPSNPGQVLVVLEQVEVEDDEEED